MRVRGRVFESAFGNRNTSIFHRGGGTGVCSDVGPSLCNVCSVPSEPWEGRHAGDRPTTTAAAGTKNAVDLRD